ncbi:uncharacterized protein LOC111479214 [Cucurbita maxima]|uniref:Uncharacterized protein LOC111479214 n=1 Tax=Cucurbita maxima TaxID=3661 RepID=A0A6J1IWW8_CUCMA|nr:uncharacterized protein LOC111479214 [Cucurbita maxima]
MGDKEAVEEGTTNGGGDLNPNAKEWSPIHDSAPEEDRCLFLTFSNGYPLTEHQIVHFFTRQFGACIERVYVHYREGGKEPPLFGKVVFVASSIPAIILEGKDEAKFCIESRTMWCKRYEARKARYRLCRGR